MLLVGRTFISSNSRIVGFKLKLSKSAPELSVNYNVWRLVETLWLVKDLVREFSRTTECVTELFSFVDVDQLK
jgi:hypothetical protein